MKRAFEMFLVLLAVYGGLHAIPAGWFWYQVDYVHVESGTQQPLKVEWLGHVKRDFLGSYSVSVRDEMGVAACDASNPTWPYKSNQPVPKERDLEWWGPSDPRCANLPVGAYTMKTCWTVLEPFWGWIPPKRKCVESEPFEVTE